MAKKKNQQNTPQTSAQVNRAATQKAQPLKQSTPVIAEDSFIRRYQDTLIALGIALITWLFLKSCLDNQFTNWDDNGYLVNDPFIKDVSAEGIKNIFSISNPVAAAVMGNYHPLTILSYAIEYSYKGLEPFIYHFDSLLFHVLVTVSVYIFIKLLSRRTIAAAITALLFGIHPMHVESVAWAAGRKDVLYGLFYILSCISYIYYLRVASSKRIAWYISMLVLFVCSLLAKPVAVTLPLVLFIIDYFERRKLDMWVFVDKAPALILSLIFGLLSVKAQSKFGAYNNLDISFTPIERIALGGYALCTYLWKAIIPVGLCNFYPYPGKPTGSLPGQFYIYPVVILALIAVIVASFRKNKVVIFGVSFFIVNILLLLQFVPVGAAIVADRYTYIPYLGLFFMTGWGISVLFERTEKKPLAYPVLAVTIVYCLVLGYLSSERCKDWYDSVSLWKNEIEEHPESPNAYNNLGSIYSEKIATSKTPQERKSNTDSSYYYLNRAIEIKPDFVNPLICLGILQRTDGQVDNAKATLLRAEKINSKDANIYSELGIVYSIKRQYDSAAFCFRNAVTLKPYFPEAHSNYANFLDITGKLDSSLNEYAVAIAQNPDPYIPYLNRARIFTRQDKYADAMKDFAKAIEKSPDMAEIYYSRSQCYNKMGNKAQALKDADKAISLGYNQVNQQYYQSLKQ